MFSYKECRQSFLDISMFSWPQNWPLQWSPPPDHHPSDQYFWSQHQWRWWVAYFFPSMNGVYRADSSKMSISRQRSCPSSGKATCDGVYHVTYRCEISTITYFPSLPTIPSDPILTTVPCSSFVGSRPPVILTAFEQNEVGDRLAPTPWFCLLWPNSSSLYVKNLVIVTMFIWSALRIVVVLFGAVMRSALRASSKVLDLSALKGV